MPRFFKNQKRGVSLIIVFLIMSICVSVALGISTILISQIKITRSMGDSVRAIYLADSGIEKTLYYDKNPDIISNIPGGVTRGICYGAISSCFLLSTNSHCSPSAYCDSVNCNNCNISFTDGFLPGVLPQSNSYGMKIVISSVNSTSTDSYFQSTGNYNGTSRLIELDILK